MRNWTALENDIASLQSHPCLWPASLSDNMQRRFSAHNQHVLEKLLLLVRLSIDDEQKEICIRQFLEMRWNVIFNSSIDYTLNPDFPANQACLKIAAFIAKKDESVCQMVMPTIKKILGTGFLPEDIKSASEDNEERFIAHHFLICLNSEALIAIVDLFSLARSNTHYLFPDGDHNEQLLNFTPEDRERLRTVVGKASATYFDALYAIHRARYDQNLSVGFALKTVQTALIKSSKKDNGSEAVANIAECRQPIFQFYQLWTALPDEIKNKIKEYKANAATFSLESYLLCLFVHIKEYCPAIEISELELERVCSESILPCTHQIGLQLEALLNHHPDLFNIPLNNSSLGLDALPNAEVLQHLSQQLEAALLTRLPSLGWCDQHAVDRIACFEILSQHCLDKKFLQKDIVALSAVIQTIEELTHALIVLPVEYWVCYLLALDKDFIANIFSPRNACVSFTQLLAHLPLRNWVSFFHAFKVTAYDQFMDSSILGVLLYEFSELQWPVLIDAMKPILNRVIVDGVDVFYLFAAIPIDYWDKIYALFSKYIETILESPAQLISTFKMCRTEEWSLILQLFKKNISEHMKYSFFLEMALKNFHPTERLVFLKHMFPYVENLSLPMQSFIRILKLFSARQFSDVLFLIGPRHCNEVIKTDIDLVVFLDHFCESDRLILLNQMSKNTFTMQIGTANLVYLMKRFPKCEDALLRLFKIQLPQIIHSFLFMFSLCDNFELEIPGKFTSAFKFLLLKILPLILSSKAMVQFSSSFFLRSFSMFHALPDPVWVVYQNFRKLEYALMAGELASLDGVMKKIAILNNFVCETNAGVIPRTSFYHELLEVFGKDFFAYLNVYLGRFYASNAVHELPIRINTPLAALPAALDEDSGNNSSFSL